jgi:nucleotide-binding universal stress UspA family protein
MAKFEKILCPVDFSVSSDRALDYALALARVHSSDVSVMHVVPRVLADPNVYPYLAEPVLTSGETRGRALEQLGAFVHRALERGIAADVILEDGDIVDAVVSKAERIGADLIVMGTHGRRGFRRLLLGSVTERLLRQSRIPVLSVAPNAAVPPRGAAPFRKILCPVDFSPSSIAGLEVARGLLGEEGAEPSGGELLVLHVVEFYFDPSLAEALVYDLTELRDKHREQAEKKLQALVPSPPEPRLRLETMVIESGAPYKEILRVAEREACDVIVMGVAGRSAADLLFFGSTTNQVVRSACCSVLTVRSRE